jgi:hypothetical protein
MGRLLSLIAMILMGSSTTSVFAQIAQSGSLPTRMNGAVGLPDLYGTSWGVASYGVPRTYTTFASPNGGGYGYGYPNYGVIPGKFGVGLWRSGLATPGYVYGSAFGYNTFPYPYRPGATSSNPSIGLYAPGFGPSSSSPYYKP